jgi:uncharacterized protein
MTQEKPLNWRLIDAISEGNESQVATLLEAGADARFDDGQPIVLACRQGNLNILKMLTSNASIFDTAHQHSHWPDMALGFACRYGHLDIVRYLIAHGANVNAHDWGGAGAPLFWAVREGHVEVCKVLIEHGANKNVRDGSLLRVAEALGVPLAQL